MNEEELKALAVKHGEYDNDKQSYDLSAVELLALARAVELVTLERAAAVCDEEAQRADAWKRTYHEKFAEQWDAAKECAKMCARRVRGLVPEIEARAEPDTNTVATMAERAIWYLWDGDSPSPSRRSPFIVNAADAFHQALVSVWKPLLNAECVRAWGLLMSMDQQADEIQHDSRRRQLTRALSLTLVAELAERGEL